MRNWKTNLGGAVQMVGTSLMGIGLVQGSTDIDAAINLKWLVITGFILNAVGNGFGALFTADKPSSTIQPVTVETKTGTP